MNPKNTLRPQALRLALVVAALAGGTAAWGQALPLTYNFNGIAHAGEQGFPDDPNGYRSISDRGLLVTGMAGQFGTDPIVGNTGMIYTINTTAFTLDLVHLGDRSLHWAYDLTADGDNIGVQPTWQVNADQTGPQVSDVSSLGIVLEPNAEIGVLHQISSGGGSFDVTLTFTDATSVTVRAAGPDWFGGTNAVPARNAGVSSQARIGGANATWPAVQNVDAADTAPTTAYLSVIETVISVPQMVLDGKGCFAGKTLASIAFGNADLPAPNANRGYGIVAASHQGSAVANPTAFGAAAPSSVVQGTTTKLKVAAVPASGAMNAITGVMVDASSIGLSGMLALNDSGTGGDETAGDCLWSADVIVPLAATAGAASLPATVTDVQNRTGVGAVNLTIVALPTVSVDLGTISSGLTVNNSLSLAASQVHWLKLTLSSPVDRSMGQYLDIDTEGSALAPSNNTEIGLYNANGVLVATDDNDGSSLLSQLSFGLDVPARPAVSTSVAYNGRDGAVLPAGDYYLAVGGNDSAFAASFGVTSTSTATGPVTVRINLGTFTGGGVPATFTELGAFGSTTATRTQAVAGTVAWFHFTLDSDVSRDLLQYLDIDTEGSTLADTSICLFRGDTGAIVTTDTNDGTDLLSQLTYGWTLTSRPAPGNGAAYNGRDGATLSSTTDYYIAVAEAPVAFGANFVAAFPGSTSADVTLNIRRGVQPPRTPVVVTGPVANPANGHSYTLWRTSPTTNNWYWTEAEQACVLAGGHLVQIEDEAENTWVMTNVLNFDGLTNRRAWLGYTDRDAEGFFVWTNGSTSLYFNWAPGEPNNANNNENYAEMIGTGMWNDLAAAGSNDYAILETEPSGGACCTGATCAVTSEAACTGDFAHFAGNGTTCNVPGNNTSPCCRADYNQSGAVSVQDIFDFLSGYFTLNPAADVNESGGVSVQDIFDFLSAYFTGCT